MSKKMTSSDSGVLNSHDLLVRIHGQLVSLEGFLDRALCRRAVAYVSPQVLTEVMVARILFDDAVSGEPLRASGVDFVHKGRTCQVYARREVVLSAGCASLQCSTGSAAYSVPALSRVPRFLNFPVRC